MNPADETILTLAEENQKKAKALVESSGIVAIWEELGVEVHPVGSLPTGLLMTHRDIDFHLYSDHPDTATGLRAMAKLAESNHVVRVEFIDGMATSERCLEYHAWLKVDDGAPWQFDMIHIERGSLYDGWAERIADKIRKRLTPETKLAILKLKYQTPDTEKIIGIEYYHAVLEGGVREFDELLEFRKTRPLSSLMEWEP